MTRIVPPMIVFPRKSRQWRLLEIRPFGLALALSMGMTTAQAAAEKAVPAPVPAPARAAITSARPAPLPPAQIKALVNIEGDIGRGTGFVAKMHGRFFIVTNEHVLSGEKKLTITGMDGTKYPVDGALYGAKDYDVAILQIPDNLAKYYLEIDQDPQTDTKAGEAVTVAGNADGIGVPAQAHGTLVGIGPDKVEVTAQFVHGNSGSPIIYRPTGQVIGIATEVETVNSLTISGGALYESTSHWLGYRLDNIPQDSGWVKLDWKRLAEEGVKVLQLDEAEEFLICLLSGKLLIPRSPELVAAVGAYRTKMGQANEQQSLKFAESAFLDLINQTYDLASGEAKQLAGQKLYPYHLNRIQEIRDDLQHLKKYVDDANKDPAAYVRALNNRTDSN